MPPRARLTTFLDLPPELQHHIYRLYIRPANGFRPVTLEDFDSVIEDVKAVVKRVATLRLVQRCSIPHREGLRTYQFKACAFILHMRARNRLIDDQLRLIPVELLSSRLRSSIVQTILNEGNRVYAVLKAVAGKDPELWKSVLTHMRAVGTAPLDASAL